MLVWVCYVVDCWYYALFGFIALCVWVGVFSGLGCVFGFAVRFGMEVFTALGFLVILLGFDLVGFCLGYFVVLCWFAG